MRLPFIRFKTKKTPTNPNTKTQELLLHKLWVSSHGIL